MALRRPQRPDLGWYGVVADRPAPGLVGAQRAVLGRGSRGARSWILAAGAAIIAAPAAGCAEPDQATLVALPGCGLEGEVLSNLRVQTRGDFPAGDTTQLLVAEGNAVLGRELGDVAGITVEGLFGETVSGVGRSARLRVNGEIPVYFGGVDELCPVQGESVVLVRSPGAMAVGALGDVLVVGGRDLGGALLDEIVHLSDETGLPQVAAQRLPAPVNGHSVHAIGPRSFLMVGGATEGDRALAGVVRLDVAADGTVRAGQTTAIDTSSATDTARAYHAAALQRDGTVLVTGGCAQVTEGLCLASETSVLASSLRIDPGADPPVFAVAPALPTARYGHALHVARDDVVFSVGGRGPEGAPLLRVDVLAPGEATWQPYGPSLTSELPDSAEIEGSAVLEGGLVLLAMDDGMIRWLNTEATGTWAGWCEPGGSSPCFVGQASRSPGASRPLIALAGERVLADHFVLPVAGVGRTGADAVDLSLAKPGSQKSPPAQRTGHVGVSLADGSILLAGGLEPTTVTPLAPLFLRLRPPLDGPDERIPSIDALEEGSLVALHPDRVQLEDGTLRLSSAGTVVGFPTVRAHVRGFRSSSFRFEVTLAASGAYPHIVLEQGAVEGFSVRFGPELIRGFSRNAAGAVVDFSCGSIPAAFWSQPQVLQVSVQPDSFTVSQGDVTLAQCPVPTLDRRVSIGVGVSGSGTVLASALRLTRI